MNQTLDLGFCATLACILEASARKPGNAYPGHDLPNLTYLELVTSATAIGPFFAHAPNRTVGETILDAITATRQVVTTNTNLGTVLLLAPLAAADLQDERTLRKVLANLTIADSERVFQAIRLAKPGGMGTATSQDLTQPPTLPLREVMALAADRDLIALQYVTDFEIVFAGAQRLGQSTAPLESAIIDLHLHLLAEHPDSLIARKCGLAEKQTASRLARAAIASPSGQTALENWFAEAPAARNPGTTADLVAACLFVALRTGKIAVPINQPWT